MRYDLRAAFRHLAKSPGATALSVLSIALGIGLTTGIFSVADAMLLRPLAINRPGELLTISSHADDGSWLGYGWLDYLDMVKATPDLATLVAYDRTSTMLSGTGEDQSVLTHAVTPNYFSVLGVRAQLGIATVDDAEGRPRAVIGNRLWQQRFGGSPQIVGKTILLNKKAVLVAGVMPAEFIGLNRGVTTDVWVSTGAAFDVLGLDDRQSRNGEFEMVARLKPGVSPARAAAVLDTAIRRADKHKAAPAGIAGTWMESRFALGWSGSAIFGGGLLLILGAVLFVACANVAQLRLAQSESRKKELGVRLALGAGAWRITRQLLIETGIVSLIGAALGILLAQFLTVKVTQFVSASSMYMDYGIRLDGRVLAFAMAALMLSVVLSGLSPARLALRLNVWDVISSEQWVAGKRGTWQKRALIAGQVAVSVALFGCAVLFVTSLRNAAEVHPGLDPHKKLLVMAVAPGNKKTTAGEWCEPACERLAALPGVHAATYARRLPLSGSGDGFAVRVEIPGLAPKNIYENNIGGNYFAVMGTRLVAGRAIDSNDRQSTQPVVVVSRTFASQLLAGKEPLGQWIKVDGTMRQVVGIAEDGPASDLHDPPSPYLFLPAAQMPLSGVTLMIETLGEPAALERAVREELKRYDSRVTIFGAGTLRRQMEEALAGDTMLASIASGLGLFGILLTAAGLFGVLQYSVSRRTRELGLRMALGARPGEIQRLVLGESLRMAAWGMPFGLGLLALASWYARSLVLGISPLDARIYVLSAGAVLALTLLAAWLPARRATRVDPMAALRSE